MLVVQEPVSGKQDEAEWPALAIFLLPGNVHLKIVTAVAPSLHETKREEKFSKYLTRLSLCY